MITLSVVLTQPNTPAQEASITNRIERAATLIGDNRIEEAEQQLNNVLRVRPNEAAALGLLGTIRAKQGKLNEAQALFVRAIRIDNKLIGVHMNLAYLYLLKGEPEKTALELNEVLRLDPNNAEAGYRLAWLLLSQSRFDECISLIDRARRTQRPSAPLLALLGDAYLRKGDVRKAEESYLLALKEQDTNADGLLGLATLYQSTGSSDAAALYLSRAKGVIADSPELFYKFAVAALNAQLAGDAIVALKRAIDLRPDEPSYYFLLGVTWLKKPDLQEAEEAFRQSLKLQPNNTQGQMYLGYTLLKQKKYPEARDWLEKSIKTESGTPETFYYLGLIAQEQSEDERAVQLLERSIQLLPSFAHAHIALGSTYLKLKNYTRAQQELEIGVKLNPNDSKAHYNLALLYARLKDPQRAREEMEIVERLKNSDGQLKEGDLVAPPSLRPR
ncbi:MAG TPA: tetratricopeptide repeat protein [Blastocatellia bacterium]|nr:tetratricopeptide repeat protein [Blastocatellia bacterium]